MPPDPFNLTEYVLRAGLDRPQHPALIVCGNQPNVFTYAELTRAILGAATGLLSVGLIPGDRLLMRLGNTLDFPIAYLAAIAVGIIPVPTSPQLTQVEVDKIAREIAPQAVAFSPGITWPRVTPIQISTKRLRSFHELPPAQYLMGDPNRLAYMIYTSGTSGTPRAVMHAHRAVWARRMMHRDWYDMTRDDRMMHAGAFNWTYTLGTGLIDPWTVGATAIIPDHSDGSPNLAAQIEMAQPTLFAAAPGIFRRLLRNDHLNLPTLRHALSAGEKLPETIRQAWPLKTGTEIHEAYGMSECSTFISGNPRKPAQPNSLGRPQKGRMIRVDAELGDLGSIDIHSNDPGLFIGYWEQPAETAKRFTGPWFQTGDLGRQLPNGDIVYEGRSDDMMNAGGFRVSPIEVETAMSKFPDLTEIACAEVRIKPDTTLIAAFYSAENLIDDQALAAHAAKNLASYKCPRLFIRVEALPRGANNKILRRQLRQDWEKAHGQT